jgi:hypothetical protein
MTTNLSTMLCQKCGKNLPAPNSTLCQSCIDSFGLFKAKVVLEGTGEYDVGVVREAQGCDMFLPPESPIIGYWVADKDGDTWVTLMSSVQAMQDSLTLAITSGAIKVKKEKAATGVKKAKKAKEVPVATPVPSREDKLAQLRALFPKKSQ